MNEQSTVKHPWLDDHARIDKTSSSDENGH